MTTFKRMQELAGIDTTNRYSEYRLDYEIPGESNNSIMGDNVKDLVNIAKEKNLKKYTIKGYIGGYRWETIINNK